MNTLTIPFTETKTSEKTILLPYYYRINGSYVKVESEEKLISVYHRHGYLNISVRQVLSSDKTDMGSGIEITEREFEEELLQVRTSLQDLINSIPVEA